MTKSALICLLITILLVTACAKESSAPAPAASLHSLAGRWELRRSSGMTVTDYPPGTGIVLVFDESTYTEYSAGALSREGRYVLVRDNTVSESTCLQINAGQFENRLVYDGDYAGRKVFVQVTRDSLTLVSGCFAYDAGSFSEYVRK